MQPENNSASAKVVTALIIGLIIGFGAGAFWQERRLGRTEDAVSVAGKGEASVVAEKADTMQTAAVGAAGTEKEALANATVGNAAILATDQTAGGTAVISQVVAAEPVWVAVREERNGGLGNILGVKRILAGTHTQVAVELLRPTVSGKKYFVALHHDAGDPAFNYREDVLTEGVQGSFTAK